MDIIYTIQGVKTEFQSIAIAAQYLLFLGYLWGATPTLWCTVLQTVCSMTVCVTVYMCHCRRNASWDNHNVVVRHGTNSECCPRISTQRRRFVQTPQLLASSRVSTTRNNQEHSQTNTAKTQKQPELPNWVQKNDDDDNNNNTIVGSTKPTTTIQ